MSEIFGFNQNEHNVSLDNNNPIQLVTEWRTHLEAYNEWNCFDNTTLGSWA